MCSQVHGVILGFVSCAGPGVVLEDPCWILSNSESSILECSMILLYVLQTTTCLGFPVWSESYALVGTTCHAGKYTSTSGLPEEGKLMPLLVKA